MTCRPKWPLRARASVVVVDGSAGVISEGDMTVLSSGQVVMGGGGSTLDVVGRNTGVQAQFSTPGTRPQVNGTNVNNDVFWIADDSTLTGLDITGGYDVCIRRRRNWLYAS